MNLHDFHFLRPAWFLALLPLAALLILLWHRRLASRSWQAVVDPQLLPHLLVGSDQVRRPWGIATLALGGLLAITALAGPVWNKQEQPVFRRDSALVVLLDLSQSMNAADVTPSRLQMARFKLRDLLAQRKEGETGLVVYAAVPFTVTPLTSDTDNINRQLNSLTPELMPVQGSRADRAIAQAQMLLQQAGASHGNVLLITDGVDNTPGSALVEAIDKLHGAGYQLSVLGVGSSEGAPVPLVNGGFLKDSDGGIVVAKYNEQALSQLAAQGDGIYRHLSAASDSDITALSTRFAGKFNDQQGKKVDGMKSDQWHEQGPWLLLPLLLMATLVFRRGYLMLLFFTLLLPTPRSAYALDWNTLWQRPDQLAAKAFADNKPQQAAKQFQDPQWRAAAHYRADDYQSALKALEGQQGAEADYNRGNALAKLGKFDEALNAYDRALKQAPQMDDAKFNRELVQKLLQQQKNNRDNGDQNAGDDKPQHGDNSSQSDDKGQKKSEGDKSRQDTAADPQQSQSDDGGKSRQEQQQPSTASSDNDSQSEKALSSSNEANDAKQAEQQSHQAEATPNEKKTDDGNTPSLSDAPTDTQPSEQDRLSHTSPPARQADANEKPQGAQATEQWLRRIPDDPGGLWRRKFLYQYKKAYQSQQGESKPW